MQERTIVSDGCSKAWAMRGWRIGLTANKALAPMFTKWVANTVLSRYLLEQSGLKAGEGDCGSVSLIQRFGPAANLNIQLHRLVLDGVYRTNSNGEPEFIETTHRLRPTCRPEGADLAGCNAQRNKWPTEVMCQLARL